MSRDQHLRVDDALPAFPALGARLGGAGATTPERGSLAATCRLHAVARGNVALIGDASGTVDAITGEGLCLAFQQAEALASALTRADLAQYAAAHRRIGMRPAFMADFMLTMDRWPDSARAPHCTLRAPRPLREPARDACRKSRTFGHGKNWRCPRMGGTQRMTTIKTLLLPLFLLGVAGYAEDVQLHLDPASTKVEWTLGDVLHTVHGTFKLKRGDLRFDASSGKASGVLVVDATSGESGSGARDGRMHKSVLKAEVPRDYVRARPRDRHGQPTRRLRRPVARLLYHSRRCARADHPRQNPHRPAEAGGGHRVPGSLRKMGNEGSDNFLLHVNNFVQIDIHVTVQLTGISVTSAAR